MATGTETIDAWNSIAGDSGNTVVDNGGDNGSIWDNVLGHGGEYLNGLANIIAAAKGNGQNTGTSNTGSGNSNTGNNNGDGNKMLIIAGVVLVALVGVVLVVKLIYKK
ncbi:MAG: hypothetical protein EBX41_00800 [Chitinophagia bacterium]|nr:hypothetical protein [Chitinophagia bacterium]